ncbi:MAG: sugar phosphate isomerase/epimerase family protein [Limnochordia bacterium]|jgi:sugar phosphate isomerase/epimerase
MKLCFSTLGCPDWSWSRVVEAAPRMGYDGLEIRGIQGEMHLPKAEPFLPHNIGNTMADLAKRGLSIACLGASSHFHGPNVDENVKEAKAYVDLAVRLRVRYVRVFGDKIPDPAKKEQTLQRVAASLRELGEYAAPQGVRILIETHGDFSRSQDLLDVLERVDNPYVGVLWDAHHPYRFCGEALADTFAQLGKYVFHVHLKDSVTTADGIRYCLPGEGDVPLRKVIELLRSGAYQGWLSFEWEKRWHPELEEPEVALPAFARVMRDLLN